MKKQYLLFGGRIGAKTGKYTGAGFTAKDNNFRFEISDEKVRLIEDVEKILSKKVTHLPITHFIFHKELFKYYPEFKSVHVFFHPISEYRKQYPELSGIIFPPVIASFDYTDKNKPSTYQLIFYIDYENTQTTLTPGQTMHLLLRRSIAELQHAIQTREGFEEEKGIGRYAQVVSGWLKEKRNLVVNLSRNDVHRIAVEKRLQFYENRQNFFNEVYQLYEEQFSEQESREAMKRMFLTSKQRIEQKPSTEKDSKKDGGIIDKLNDKISLKDLFMK